MEKIEGLAEKIVKIGGLEDFISRRNGNFLSFLVLGPDSNGVLSLLETGRLVQDRGRYLMEVWNSNIMQYQLYALENPAELAEAAYALADMSDDHSNRFWKKDF